jgi:hypothetical protein
MPAQAGIQILTDKWLDSRFRGNDTRPVMPA